MFRLPPSRKRAAIAHYLENTVQEEMPILAYDAAAAAWFAEERTRLTQNGRPPSYPDGQIAAIAATNALILVTRNTADFTDFSGLPLENWFEEGRREG